MSNNKKIATVVGVLVVIGVVLYAMFGMENSNLLGTGEKVATVNGVAITKEYYDEQLALVTASLQSQGVDTTDAAKIAEIRTQVLNDLINNELVLQGVKSAGIEATDAEVDTQFQAIVTQNGGDAGFKAALAQANLTETQLKKNIENQIAIQKYLLANVDVSTVTVTDAEITSFYNDYKAQQGTTTPALATISEDIKEQITLTKQQELVNQFVAGLRAKAVIETTL